MGHDSMFTNTHGQAAADATTLWYLKPTAVLGSYLLINEAPTITNSYLAREPYLHQSTCGEHYPLNGGELTIRMLTITLPISSSENLTRDSF